MIVRLAHTTACSMTGRASGFCRARISGNSLSCTIGCTQNGRASGSRMHTFSTSENRRATVAK